MNEGIINGQRAQSTQLDQILQALDAVHDPRSSNELRHGASCLLEQIRESAEAPEQGFKLASARDQLPIARHFGLSLIDFAIRNRWADYTREQSAVLRGWVLELAHGCSDRDPGYLINKIAELWVEIAKRSWAIDWMDMDELLVRLWDSNMAQKMIALNILESLSDEIFTTEDHVAALRGNDLNRACVDIIVPSSVLTEQFPAREMSVIVRYGSEGWLSRLSDALDRCTSQEALQQDLGLRILSAFRSFFPWIIPRALVSTSSVHRICACLAVSNMAFQMAAIDTLHALYNRPRFSEGDFRDIVGPMFHPDTVNLMSQLYKWLLVDPNDIDDSKYRMLKRLSETVFNLGRLSSERPSYVFEGSDLTGFIDLLMEVMRNDSLQVSIPALHLWVKLLTSQSISKLPAVRAVMGGLLETCSQRLIRYEALPTEAPNSSIIFLNEDIETLPERHAFLGNYARFCNQVVELVVQQRPIDALYHILGQADHVLHHLYDVEPPFIASAYTKNSIPWLKIDAQFTVIEAALKGCLKWLTSANNSESIRRDHEVMTSNLQVWCDRLLGLTFEDPMVKERVIQLAVGFAIGPLKQDPEFAVRVFDKVLGTRCDAFPESAAYTEAVKDLQIFTTQQLQRLALRFADHLMTIFAEVENKVLAVSQQDTLDDQTASRYTSILFVIMHRATNVDDRARVARLEVYLQPLLERWQDNRLTQSLSSLATFGKLLVLDDVQQYLISRQAHNIEDWASQSLDQEGIDLQSRLQRAIDGLPLRPMKHLMGASLDKLELGTRSYATACVLWRNHIPILLPTILQFISCSHAFYEPNEWAGDTPEIKQIVRRIFTDRFWQVGISKGTRDDFYASIGVTRTTVEGFASSVRAALRLVRETSYRLLYYMSQLKEEFYGLRELAEPLAKALFTDACALSPHQMAILVDTIRPIIENCPKECRPHFLTPIVSALFEQVDRKTNSEWERIEQRKSSAAEDDDLTTEMKDESVLRQLTLVAVTLVVGLLEPAGASHIVDEKKMVPNGTSSSNTARDFVIQTPTILKPLILFCTHALRMHDTRASSLIAKVLRTIIGDFSGESALEADVREFISTEVLKACITSLNDAYFVDMQKDFASLIASILISYSSRTTTPEDVICSLPGMAKEKVTRAIRHLFKAQSDPKKQRAIVLDLLQVFRGVTIHEQGRLPKQDPDKLRSVMQQKYMAADMEGMELKGKDDEPNLDGIAEMFT